MIFYVENRALMATWLGQATSGGETPITTRQATGGRDVSRVPHVCRMSMSRENESSWPLRHVGVCDPLIVL